MPAFSLAILWKPLTDATRLRAAAESLDLLLTSDQVQHVGAVLRPDGAALHLRVDRMLTGPQVVKSLSQEVTLTGGELVEVWRMQKGSRDAFRAQQLTPERTFPAVPSAVDAVARHLEKLSEKLPQHASAAVVGADAGPATRSASAASTVPAQGEPSSVGEEWAEARMESTDPIVFAIEDVPAAASVNAAPAALEEPRGAMFLEPPRPAPGAAATASEIPTSSGRENRRARRYDVQLGVTFGSDAAFVREHATNISRGGLFVETLNPPAVGTTVEVKVTLPSGDVLVSPAMVAHVVSDGPGPGVGLSFSESEASFIWALDRYLSTLG